VATAGVLATRGKSADIYPETTLTFRLDIPLLVSTARSQKAFLPVTPADYNTEPTLKVPVRPEGEQELHQILRSSAVTRGFLGSLK
jgi:hypothetical protein